MSDVIECPSGLAGQLRGIKGKEIKVLTDRGIIRRGEVTDALLDACWEATTDPGPYTGAIRDNGKPDWQQVLQGDRFFLATRIHALTYGPLEITTRCPNEDCKNHKRGFVLAIDMVKELPVKKLAPEDRVAFVNGNEFQTALPDGREMVFRLRTGADEKRFLQKGITEDDALKMFIPIMVTRILRIDGVDDAKKKQFFDEADLQYCFDSLAAMDEHDCGVETTFENECPACYTGVRFEIPFRKALLAPGTRKPKPSASSSDDDLTL
jgi:hypothetical protein